MNKCPIFLFVAVVFYTVGCTQKWGDLPPYQYSGTVINEISQKPVDDADVFFRRSGLKFSFWPMVASETLASTETSREGNFNASTNSGYAQWIYANAYGKYGASIDVPRESTSDLVIQLRPVISTITSRVFDRSEGEKQYQLQECVEQIIYYHERHEGNYLSMKEYLKLSVINDSQYQFVEENFALFSFPKKKGFSKVFVSWGNDLFALHGMDLPIGFTQVPRGFYYPSRTLDPDNRSNSEASPLHDAP
ncbi:MAG: hypothetical protein ACSHX8_07695 [Opitutaceae bacterium]